MSLLDNRAVVKQISDVSEFIQGSPKERLPLVERMAAAGGSYESFNLRQLMGAERLSEALGAESPTLQKLLSIDHLDFDQLANFASESPTTKALLEEQADKHSDSAMLQIEQLRALASLHEIFGKDSKVMTEFSRLPVGTLKDLDSFVQEYKAPAVKLIADTVSKPHNDFALRPDNLLAALKLGEWYGADSTIMSALSVPPTTEFLPGLVRFISKHSEDFESRREQVRELVEGGGSIRRLSEEFLTAWDGLSKTFGKDSPTFETIRKLDRENPTVVENISALIANGAVSPETFVKLLANGAISNQLAYYAPHFQTIFEAINPDDQMTKHLLKLNGSGWDNSDLSNYLKGASDEEKRSIRQMVESGAGAVELNSDNLASRSALATIFGADSPILRRILELNHEGLNIHFLKVFIEDKPENLNLVRNLVTDTTTAEELAASRLRAITNIFKVFGQDSETTNRLLQLEKQGASLESFGDEIKGAYSAARNLVLQMLEEGTSANSFNTHYFTRECGWAPRLDLIRLMCYR